jgi:hypothetical protein
MGVKISEDRLCSQNIGQTGQFDMSGESVKQESVWEGDLGTK